MQGGAGGANPDFAGDMERRTNPLRQMGYHAPPMQRRPSHRRVQGRRAFVKALPMLAQLDGGVPDPARKLAELLAAGGEDATDRTSQGGRGFCKALLQLELAGHNQM